MATRPADPPAGTTFAPLRPEHLAALTLQPAQAHLAGTLANPGLAGDLLILGPAWSVLADGRPVACGGCFRALGPPVIAWALLSPDAGRLMPRLTRAVRRFLDLEGSAETGVEWGHAEGARWARLLGFRPTGRPVERWACPEKPLELWER